MATKQKEAEEETEAEIESDESQREMVERLFGGDIVTYRKWGRVIEMVYDETTNLISMSIYTEIDNIDEYPDNAEGQNKIYQEYGERAWDFLEEKLDKETFEKLIKTSKEVDVDADIVERKGAHFHELMLEFDKDYIDLEGLFFSRKENEELEG